MTWRCLSVVVDRGAIEQVSSALFELGAQGVQEDYLPGQTPAPKQPWEADSAQPAPQQQVLKAWFEDPNEPLISAAFSTHSATWADVEDTNWETSWQEGFDPIIISPTLTIAAPWNAPDGALIIEPGQGFGTGQHPSTHGALALMEPVLHDLRTCLDVGSGSGVLALLAARQGLSCLGIDVEEAAVRDAQENALRNNLTAEFSTRPIHQVEGTYDLVLANLHAELIVRLAPHIVRLTGRVLICAGILADRESIVREQLDADLHLEERVLDGEWVALRYRTRS
ncbi:MAG: 50S ribosomal protein L11 methyltransferase [Myxococcota bacterium]